MSQQEPPKIEFPCNYPIKVVGRRCEQFNESVLTIFERHAPDFDAEAITVKSSSGGKFISLTIVIEASGVAQLEALHKDLMATGLVSMVI